MLPKSPHCLALLAQLTLLACSSSSTTNPSERSAAPQGEVIATAPSSAAPPAPALSTGAPSSVAPPAPALPTGAPTLPAIASAAPAASAAPSDDLHSDPLPKVKVANIGMHIGGGPNDAVTKEPIRSSVEPHFDAFRRCFARVTDQEKGGDFGIDLRIQKEGGKAEATKPRTSLKGEGFTKCVLDVFTGIDFLKPKGGLTVVSYSLRFTP